MDLYDRDLIKQLDAKYLKQTGIGQFSFYRFADFIMETQPDLARRLISDILKKELCDRVE